MHTFGNKKGKKIVIGTTPQAGTTTKKGKKINRVVPVLKI